MSILRIDYRHQRNGLKNLTAFFRGDIHNTEAAQAET
jgi:hypothetical protein